MLVMGLMSGTSADGIEAALVRVEEGKGGVRRELVGHATVKMDERVRREILRVAEGGACTAGEISQLNFRVGEEFARAALEACGKFRIPAKKIGLIGSHGQTIFHQGRPVPFLGRKTASTLQIGEGAVIAARTGITTIEDFRVADMAVDGQGAPLVPYVDWLLYGDKKLGRVSLNLGGIGNVTVLPAGGDAEKVFAFDTGPGNMVIDGLVAHFTKGRERFDKDGQRAIAGTCVTGILQELLRDPFLREKPPKSTGREYYGASYLKRVLALGKKFRARPENLVRTATVFTALSVVDALNRFVLPRVKIAELIVSGGGARNPVLMGQLEAALAPIKVGTSARFGVPEEAKEAYAFAVLAYESWKRRAGNLRSATGAKKRVVLGKICWGG